MSKREELILVLNKATKANPLPRHRVAEILETGDRRARITLHELKEEGLPIFAAETGGYYWAQTDEELEEAIRHYEAGGISILATCYKLRRRNLTGQISLEEIREGAIGEPNDTLNQTTTILQKGEANGKSV